MNTMTTTVKPNTRGKRTYSTWSEAEVLAFEKAGNNTKNTEEMYGALVAMFPRKPEGELRVRASLFHAQLQIPWSTEELKKLNDLLDDTTKSIPKHAIDSHKEFPRRTVKSVDGMMRAIKRARDAEKKATAPVVEAASPTTPATQPKKDVRPTTVYTNRLVDGGTTFEGISTIRRYLSSEVYREDAALIWPMLKGKFPLARQLSQWLRVNKVNYRMDRNKTYFWEPKSALDTVNNVAKSLKEANTAPDQTPVATKKVNIIDSLVAEGFSREEVMQFFVNKYTKK